MNLCFRVREMLPSLLENDGELRPELAAAVYGHLAICAPCTQEFEAQQRVILLVQSLGEAELPMDFSSLIMQRIQGDTSLADMPKQKATPPFASASPFAGEVSAKDEANVSPRLQEGLFAPPVNNNADLTKQQTVQNVTLKQEKVQTKLTVGEETLATRVGLWERLTVAGMLAAVMAFFLMTDWGVQSLGTNVQSVANWLGEIGETLRRVPLLGALFTSMLAALTQVGDLLGQTYRALGPMAAQGLALDVALCVGGYYFLVARKQRGQMRGF